jgi:predicted dehydrogenase
MRIAVIGAGGFVGTRVAAGLAGVAPDPELVALFSSYPRLRTDVADSLGFHRDADPDALVANALPEPR